MGSLPSLQKIVLINSQYKNFTENNTYNTMLIHHFILKDKMVSSLKEIQDVKN